MGMHKIQAELSLSYKDGRILSVTPAYDPEVAKLFRAGQYLKYSPADCLLEVDGNVILFDMASMEIISRDNSEMAYLQQKGVKCNPRSNVTIKFKFYGPVQTLNGDSPEITSFINSGRGEVVYEVSKRFAHLDNIAGIGELDPFFGPDPNVYYPYKLVASRYGPDGRTTVQWDLSKIYPIAPGHDPSRF